MQLDHDRSHRLLASLEQSDIQEFSSRGTRLEKWGAGNLACPGAALGRWPRPLRQHLFTAPLRAVSGSQGTAPLGPTPVCPCTARHLVGDHQRGMLGTYIYRRRPRTDPAVC